MKWTKPNGTEIETRDTEEIRAYLTSLGYQDKKPRGRPKRVKDDDSD